VSQVMESHEVEINGKTYPVRCPPARSVLCGVGAWEECGRPLMINDKQNENRSKLLTSLSLSVRWCDVNLSD
jgi:hypothetical protein